MRSFFVTIPFRTIAVFFASAAFASTIPITGTGSIGGESLFDLVGPGFSASSHPPGGPWLGGFCADGTCDLSSNGTQIQAWVAPLVCWGECGWSKGSLNGAYANALQGALFLPRFVSIPSLPQGLAPGDVTALGSYPFSGDLTAFLQLPDGSQRPVFAVSLLGSVKVKLGLQGSAPNVYFNSSSYQFSGTATPTPEPGSVLCVGIALAMIGFWMRKTRRWE
jgi:hypothetical protein